MSAQERNGVQARNYNINGEGEIESQSWVISKGLCRPQVFSKSSNHQMKVKDNHFFQRIFDWEWKNIKIK